MDWTFLPWVAAAQRRERLAAEERFLAREQQKEQLDLLREALHSMVAVSNRQADVFQRFLDSFNIAEPPKVREFDEETEMERYMQRRQQQRDTPAPLRGLSREDQMSKLIDKLDSFALD